MNMTMKSCDKIFERISTGCKMSMFNQLINNLEKILYKQNINCKEYSYVRLQIQDTDYYSFFRKFYNFMNIDGHAHSVRMSGDGFGFGFCTSNRQPSTCQMLIHTNGINVWECGCDYNKCLVVKLRLDKFNELFFSEEIHLQ